MLTNNLLRFSMMFETRYFKRNFDRVADVITPPYNSKCLKRQMEFFENIQSAVSYSILKTTINIKLLMQYFYFLLLVYVLWEILMRCERFVKQTLFDVCRK